MKVNMLGNIWETKQLGRTQSSHSAASRNTTVHAPGCESKNSPSSESFSLLCQQDLAVPKVGLEPTWGNPHYALNVARLPIPPLRLAECIVSTFTVLSTWMNFFTQWIQSCFLSSGWPVVGQSCNQILMQSFTILRFCLQDCNVNVLIGRNKNYMKTSCRCTSQASTRRYQISTPDGLTISNTCSIFIQYETGCKSPSSAADKFSTVRGYNLRNEIALID